MQALREQFSKVRVFAFVERADEVTHLFAPGAELSGVMQRVLREADLVAFDGHSDYGGSLGGFAEHWGGAITSKTSLLILGDGRTNYRDPNLTVLRRLVGHGAARALAQPRAAPPVGQRRFRGPALRRRPARCTSAAPPRSSRPSSRRCCPSDLRRGRDVRDFEPC